METVIEIGVIDNDRMLVQGMAGFVAATGDIVLTDAAVDVQEYLAGEDRARIVILDLNLENFTDPARNVAELVAAGFEVIVFSVIPDQAYIASTTEAGAAAYITKNNNLDALAEVVRAVSRGGAPTTPEHAFWLSRDDRPNRPHLTPREEEILGMVGRGVLHKTVARQLGISVSTVTTHLERVRRKYAETGRPIKHPAHYAERIRGDGFGRERLGPKDGETNQ